MSGVLLHINDISGGPTPSASALEAAARATLATGLVSGVPVEDAEISITLAPADRIRELNRDYHGVDAATDVLAFPLGEGGRLLADVYVCPAAAAASAREHEITAQGPKKDHRPYDGRQRKPDRKEQERQNPIGVHRDLMRDAVHDSETKDHERTPSSSATWRTFTCCPL